MKLQPKLKNLRTKNSCSSMPSADATPHLHIPEKEKNRSLKPESCFLTSPPHLRSLGQFPLNQKYIAMNLNL